MAPSPADSSGGRDRAPWRLRPGRVAKPAGSSTCPTCQGFVLFREMTTDRGDGDVDFCSAFSRRRRYHLSGGCMGSALILMLAAVGR